MITDYKTLLINLGTFIFSMTNIDIVLKKILRIKENLLEKEELKDK